MRNVLIAGAILGITAFMVGAGAMLGVALGTRALVVSAATVKPAAMLAPMGYVGVPPVLAMGGAAEASN